MRVELPVFKRCCCCLPLRYGLIVMSYFRLLLTLFILTSLGFGMYFTILRHKETGASYYINDLIFQICFSLIFLTEFCLNIVFLVGGHQKNAKLLRIFYIHNIVLLSIFTIGLMVLSVFDVIRALGMPKDASSFYLMMWSTQIATAVPWIGIHFYYILLIRSEMLKLENNCKFRFTNMTAEAECSMENETARRENGTLDRGNGTDDQIEHTDEQTIETIDEAKETSLRTNGKSNPITKTSIIQNFTSNEKFNYQKL